MKNYYSIIAVLFSVFYSCSNNDEISQEIENGFFVNSEFNNINRGYYQPDLSTDQLDDFYVIVTNGNILSYSSTTNKFDFSDNTTNVVIFRAIQNPQKPLALNFVPNGFYEYNSTNESFSDIEFHFNCITMDGTLQTCNDNIQIEDFSEINAANIEIDLDTQATIIYSIYYNFESSNGINIKGQFVGNLDRIDF